MIRSAVVLSLLTMSVLAQEVLDPSIRDVRVTGLGFRGLPIVTENSGIRIEFDGSTSQPTDYRIRVRHLDAQGRETENVFVNDPLRLATLSAIPHRPAPAGVRGWRWRYAITIPGPPGLEALPHSGYYRGWIQEAESGRDVATFEFVRADEVVSGLMKVRQRRIPSAIAPYNEGIAVTVTIPVNREWSVTGPLQPMLIRSVDVVKNREWVRRTRVEIYDDDPNTWVEGAGTGTMTYVAGGLLPGNEYRQIDLRSLDEYPSGDVLRPRSGADVSRFFFPGRPDHDGASAVVADGRGADAEPTEFQFLWEGSEDQRPSIAVVGDFSGWKVRPEWTLTYDSIRGRYVVTKPLRRGRYDYQYVLDGTDWVRLEGNDWRTKNVYTALIVYSDPSYGGYDRVIGVAQLESTGALPGGNTRE